MNLFLTTSRTQFRQKNLAGVSIILMTDTKPRAQRKLQSKSDVVYETLSAKIEADEAAAAAPETVSKKSRKPTGPPSEKQLAARAQFKQKVVEAQALRKAEPGLKYNEAIKRVYGKVSQ